MDTEFPLVNVFGLLQNDQVVFLYHFAYYSMVDFLHFLVLNLRSQVPILVVYGNQVSDHVFFSDVHLRINQNLL
jgi:hypothetical protein